MDFFADQILTAAGWRTDVRIQVDDDGLIVALEPGAARAGCESIHGIVLPGMPNLHCHAFQRAMAGRAEVMVSGSNDFWSWRGAMYSLANSLDPERLHAVAAQAYMEMLKCGYTSVAEFHYVHHGLGGATPAEMSRALIGAAEETGIALTLVPVYYRTADFGEQPALTEQRCFVHTPDSFVDLLDTLAADCDTGFRLGIAMHSLRAVPQADLQLVLNQAKKLLPGAPVHMHVAEQQIEVDRCIAHYGARPVEWLLANTEVDANWCLVHATHMTPDEIRGLAQRRCVAGLCPSTEANLGDGIFPLATYLEDDGIWGIGSDSNVSMDPFEELRLLEYGQRLLRRRRNIAVSADLCHNGGYLWRRSVAGGAHALGQRANGIALGNRADWIVLDADHPGLFDKQDDFLLDALIFAGYQNVIRSVYSGGRRVVENGRHHLESNISQRFIAVQKGFWETH